MKRLLMQAGWAALLGCHLAATPVMAQSVGGLGGPGFQTQPGALPPGQPIIHNYQGQIAANPHGGMQGAYNYPTGNYQNQYGPYPGQTPTPAATGRPGLDLLNRCGIGCEATHNTIGCTSCYATSMFIFGSCRQFFGIACEPLQPKPHPCAGLYLGGGLLRGAGPFGCNR